MKTDLQEIESRSEAFRRYDGLLRQLHRLEAANKGETDEADDVRDQMDAPFARLSPDERSYFKSLSAQLYKREPQKYVSDYAPQDFVSSQVEIRGSIKFQKKLIIDGIVEGNIESDGILILGDNANIHGDIKTKSITVYGKVVGNITVGERLELKSHSTIQGDLKAKRIVIEEGATFIGKSDVSASEPRREPPAKGIVVTEKQAGAVA